MNLNTSPRYIYLLLLAATSSHFLNAAGPDIVDLGSTEPFVILSGAGITTTGGGAINGNVGASPITGSAIGVTCDQVNGTIYAVDASGPACAVIDSTLLTTAKGDLTTAYNDAAGRTPTPTGPNLNPGLIPGSGNIGGMTLAPGLYKFTTTALISGSDVTLMGAPDDVWIFQCAQDLQLASGIKVILAGGARAENIFWQVGTSAVLGTSSVFKGTILADQAITMETSSTLEGRALAFGAGVVYNGVGAVKPVLAVDEPEIVVEQPLGQDILDGGSKDFGSVAIGDDSSLVFTIRNTGASDLTGLDITMDGADASLFTVTADPTAPVGPDGDTTFTVLFAPQLPAGLKTATLRIASNDTSENPFDIALTGTATLVAVPEIVVEQPLGVDLPDGGSQDFGTIAAGLENSLVFTIRNTGTADLTGLAITIDGVDASLFTVTASPTAPVSGPNGDTTFTVRFAPLTTGLKTAALRIASNDASENPFDIALTGTATADPEPEIVVEQPLGQGLLDGGSKDFGSVVLGEDSNLVFRIRNTGTADLTGLAITIDGADASLFTVTANPTAPVSGPNGVTTFTVRFFPFDSGLKTAALRIASNDASENPFDIALTGTATAVPVPEIVVEQPLGADILDGGSKDFGSVAAGNNSSLVFAIRNTGAADLTGLAIMIDGADASLFTVTADPSAPVGPDGGTAFTVRFAPLTAGLKTAALHIASNDASENPFDIALTGTATAVPVPEIVVEQPLGVDMPEGGSKDFGSVAAGDDSSLVFAIRNTGSADLTGLAITIDGTDASLFTVTADPTAPVGPDGGTAFTVRFAPLTAGLKTAALHIASNDTSENPFDIALTGTATAVPVPEIVVEQPLGVDMPEGGSKDFGSVEAGDDSSLIFTIRNTGSADLTGLAITIVGADASLFTVTANPTAPVGPNGGTAFTVRFAPVDSGLKAATLRIASNDTSENPFEIALAGTATQPVDIAVMSPIILNPQTGLFEQTVRITNTGLTSPDATRVSIQGLPADVQVYNAAGDTEGVPFVQYNYSLAPAGSVDLVIEYYRPSREAIPQPTFVAEGSDVISVIPPDSLFAIDRILLLEDGRVLIEFSAVEGRTYGVQYSSDMTDWKTVVPTITAPTNRVQWYDDGPPKTESRPEDASSRFYRIFELP